MNAVAPKIETMTEADSRRIAKVGVDSEPQAVVPTDSETSASSLFPAPTSGSAGLAEPDDSLVALTQRLKQELVERFERGERPTAAEYLEKFPRIVEDRDRVVSLIYEEYCLHEEFDERPTPEAFCDRYDAWRDSLASQLRYHRLLSSRADLLPPKAAAVEYPKPGETFAGRFPLVGILGEGGTARVFLAEQPDMGNRRVALKVTRQLGKEPAIQGRLNHPHIVPVWSVDRDENSKLLGLCMPYRAGFPLDRVLKRIDPRGKTATALSFWKVIQDPTEASIDDPSGLPGWLDFPTQGTYSEAAAWVALVIARALAYAHSQGILHRDVKPANLLLTGSEGPQLLDFNLADSPEDADHAQQAMQGGTLPYMAPEQLQAFLDPKRWDRVGAAADVYSLGLVLVEMLTGQRPEAPRDKIPLPRLINELLDLRARTHWSVRDVNPAIPHALAAIVAKCLNYETAERYQTAGQLADDLERFLKRRPLAHAVNPSRGERAANWFHRRRPVLAAVAALVVVGGLTAFAGASSAVPDSSLFRDAAVSWLQKHPTIQTPEQKARLIKVRNDLERLASRDPSDFISRSNLAYIARMHEGDSRKALDYLDQAVAIMEDRRDVSGNQWAQALFPRAVVRCDLGDVARNAKDLATARGFFLGAFDDLKKISEQELEAHLGESFILIYHYLNITVPIQLVELAAQPRAESSKELYRMAMDHLEELERKARAIAYSNPKDSNRFLKAVADLRPYLEAKLAGLGSHSKVNE